MQSSPPVRAWERRDSREQDESDYSLDLGALDMDTVSDMDIPKQHVDRIFSEDIDGPSDFTQNMEMWMRGGKTPSRKGTLKGAKSTTQPIEEGREDMDDNVIRRDMLEVPQNETRGQHDEHTGSHKSNHTPDTSPPKASPSVHEEPFSSEWHTYDSTSTPAPPVHKQFLQPTVEEYYSELSPGQRASVHSRGRSLYSPRSAQKHSPSKEDESTPGRASSPTLSPVRSPILQRSAPNSRPGTAGTAYSKEAFNDEEKNELERQLSQLSAKCQQLEHLNEALDRALEEDKRTRKEESDAHEARLAEATRRERDLAEMKEAAYKHNDGFRREFAELKEKLRDQERLADNARLGSEGSERELGDEIKRLRDQMDAQQTEHRQEVKTLEQDVQLARRSRDDAVASAKAHREELEARNGLQEAEIERLRTALQEAHEDEATIEDLERRLSEANAEVARLKQDKGDLETMISAVRGQLAKSKFDQGGQVSKVTAERTRAVELAAGLQRQLTDLRQQLRDEQTSHEEELEQIRSSYSQADQTTAQELQVIQAELQAKQTELNEAILERDEAKDALQIRESEVEKASAELDDAKAVNVALDSRITEKMQRRDRYWREKLEEADRERQLMAKALMHQWGREEVGIESPQLYKYRYASPEKERERPKSMAAP
ncbi:hypothetical protein CLAFUW4_07159 [Fulvia fulva]|uniref:Uncharacterized protein n=1 Tax=Passalora fulva TaxID=5499 RepID=A0A9Q8P9R6_PASFU|nr:uncharacterized protein CLAFUR5_07293 [Fulvia fulva]KAK4622265.1 hypothetical protein CLAFUR4_07168 [Fulvia fulva]KAK4623342.1 hypothetical protein CLAFUR0_07166 [Fulvia fulva]UJO18554.1 hypothetical protein CLAFUR5_07293 [Fulvia fulva]WPV16504.1 hypothetical protein CLAFUW4_07159 [Fulvia fulva]WPV30974.1 hypothetical protein CLAFUW7_07160 [Fulvia fulva]